MNKRFHIVAKAKLKKKKQAEREAKDGKRPKLPWKKASDSAGQSLGAITEMSFKDYLMNEAKYYKHDENEPLYSRHPGDKTVRIISSKGPHVEIQDVYNGETSVLTRSTFNRLYKKLVKGWQHMREAKYYKDSPTHIHVDGQIPILLIDDSESPWGDVVIRDLDTGEEHKIPYDEFEMEYEKLKEARYYLAQDDWQEDIDEHGSGIGVCPKCRGEARYETDHHPRGGMYSHWVCQNEQCGYEER